MEETWGSARPDRRVERSEEDVEKAEAKLKRILGWIVERSRKI